MCLCLAYCLFPIRVQSVKLLLTYSFLSIEMQMLFLWEKDSLRDHSYTVCKVIINLLILQPCSSILQVPRVCVCVCVISGILEEQGLLLLIPPLINQMNCAQLYICKKIIFYIFLKNIVRYLSFDIFSS